MEIIIKLDHDEPVKVKTSSIYGEQHPLPDWDPEYLWAELHKTKERYLQAEMDIKNHEDEIQDLNEQIQDLKLENDRLKQRGIMMLAFIKSARCSGMSCGDCMFFNDTYPSGKKCIYNRENDIFSNISSTAGKILKDLEAL